MRQVTLAGHPLHPQVIAGPTALFPFGAVLDVMYLVTGRKSFAEAAYYSLVGGYATGLISAVSGVADYLTISPGGPMKQTANTHGILNGTLMAVATVNLAMRKKRRSGVAATVLSLIGTAMVVASGWYGGELVYEHGMRVKPATERKQPQARIPGDQSLERGFKRLAEVMPVGGPGKEE